MTLEGRQYYTLLEDAQFYYWPAKLLTGAAHPEQGYGGIDHFGHFAELIVTLEFEQAIELRERNKLLSRFTVGLSSWKNDRT